jgi:hypothetical protein
MEAKLTRLTHEIAIQLHVMAESCTICSSRFRRPVRELLVIPSCVTILQHSSRTIRAGCLSGVGWGGGGRTENSELKNVMYKIISKTNSLMCESSEQS